LNVIVQVPSTTQPPRSSSRPWLARQTKLDKKVRLIPAEDEFTAKQELANAAQVIGLLPATLQLQVSERHVLA
jgi:hypothetical protein